MTTWWEGPTNAIDRQIILFGNFDAIDISWRLEIPTYLARERLAHYHAQHTPLAALAAPIEGESIAL